jgi:hypothetical protein
MRKENLIVVHSFPSNSIVLGGLIEYLSDYFEVYFIDLPGFTKTVPALDEISFGGYVKFIAVKIQEFELRSYWLGGISFGFFLISQLQPDPTCQGFVGLEPYIGLASLRMGLFKRLFYSIFCKTIIALKLSSFLWSNPISRKHLPKLRPYPPEHIDTLFDQLDSRTFFKTAALILGEKTESGFTNSPYILIANKDDQTLDYNYILQAFAKNVQRLLVVNTTVDHYPADLTKAYFKTRIPATAVKKVCHFMADTMASNQMISSDLGLPLTKADNGQATTLVDSPATLQANTLPQRTRT